MSRSILLLWELPNSHGCRENVGENGRKPAVMGSLDVRSEKIVYWTQTLHGDMNVHRHPVHRQNGCRVFSSHMSIPK